MSQQQSVRVMQRFGARRRRVPLVRGPLLRGHLLAAEVACRDVRALRVVLAERGEVHASPAPEAPGKARRASQ